MTYWSSASLISRGVGSGVGVLAASFSSSSARISLHSEMHSLQMYTEGPEMNRFTASLDFPQKEQRRCLSLAIKLQLPEERRWLPRVLSRDSATACAC